MCTMSRAASSLASSYLRRSWERKGMRVIVALRSSTYPRSRRERGRVETCRKSLSCLRLVEGIIDLVSVCSSASERLAFGVFGTGLALLWVHLLRNVSHLFIF